MFLRLYAVDTDLDLLSYKGLFVMDVLELQNVFVVVKNFEVKSQLTAA